MNKKYLAIFLCLFLSLSLAHKFETEDEEEFVQEEKSFKENKENIEPPLYDEKEDSEEFIGEPAYKETKEIKAEGDVNITVRPVIEAPKVWYLKYVYEMIFIGLFVIFIIQAYRGQKHNKLIVGAWLGKNIDVFKEQFSSIGIEQVQEGELPKAPVFDGETQVRGAYIEQHSYNSFKFYATGRLNCEYCLVKLDLKKRQDLFTMTTFNLLWPEIDKISFEIPLSFPEPFPCVFSIIRRNEMKLLLEDNKILVMTLDITHRKIILRKCM